MSVIGHLRVMVSTNTSAFSQGMRDVQQMASLTQTKLREFGNQAQAAFQVGAKNSANAVKSLADAATTLHHRMLLMGRNALSASSALAHLNIINLEVLKGMEHWNILGVAAGPGRIVPLLDRMRQALTGTVAPIRELNYAITRFAVPALSAMGIALAEMTDNPAAQKLGGNLLQLAHQISGLGKSFKLPLIRAMGDGLRSVGTIATQTARGMQTLGTNLAKTFLTAPVGASALTRLNGSLSVLTQAAMQAGRGLVSMRGEMWNIVKGTAALGAHVTILTGKLMMLGGKAIYATVVGLYRLGQAAKGAWQAMRAGKPAMDATEASMKRLATTSQSTASGITPMKAGFMELAPTLAIFGAAAAGAIMTVRGLKKGISLAADFEQTEMGFAVLLGSFDKAKERMTELKQFATTTPFLIPEIMEASRVLQVYGGSNLAASKNLQMVGDMAAASKRPIDEVANAVGRAYTAIRSGQPFGQAAQALQQMGLLTGPARIEMQRMQDAGASAEEIWAKFTASAGRFAGTMALQTETTAGMFTKLKDNVLIALADIGQSIIDAFSFREAMTAGIHFFHLVNNEWMPAIKAKISDAAAIIQDTMTAAWYTAEFAARNWQDVMLVALLGTSYGVVKFANLVTYYLTQVLPAYVQWFGQNWRDIFLTSFDFVATILINLGTNIRNFFSELWDWIASGGKDGFQFDFTPLTQGFANSIRQLPQIAERIPGEIEAQLGGELAAVSGRLGEDFTKGLADKMKANQDARDKAEAERKNRQFPGAAHAPEEDIDAKEKTKEKLSGIAAVTKGSVDAYKALEAARRANTKEKDQHGKAIANATATTVSEIKETNRLLREQKQIKLAVIGGS